ncbi:hypothetical protein R3P38DRAFT_2838479, partial [Favolaschia claudopus]
MKLAHILFLLLACLLCSLQNSARSGRCPAKAYVPPRNLKAFVPPVILKAFVPPIIMKAMVPLEYESVPSTPSGRYSALFARKIDPESQEIQKVHLFPLRKLFSEYCASLSCLPPALGLSSPNTKRGSPWMHYVWCVLYRMLALSTLVYSTVDLFESDVICRRLVRRLGRYIFRKHDWRVWLTKDTKFGRRDTRSLNFIDPKRMLRTYVRFLVLLILLQTTMIWRRAHDTPVVKYRVARPEGGGRPRLLELGAITPFAFNYSQSHDLNTA